MVTNEKKDAIIYMQILVYIKINMCLHHYIVILVYAVGWVEFDGNGSG